MIIVFWPFSYDDDDHNHELNQRKTVQLEASTVSSLFASLHTLCLFGILLICLSLSVLALKVQIAHVTTIGTTSFLQSFLRCLSSSRACLQPLLRNLQLICILRVFILPVTYRLLKSGAQLGALSTKAQQMQLNWVS